MDIQALAAAQRAFFRSGATLDLSFRRQALDRLAPGRGRYRMPWAPT